MRMTIYSFISKKNIVEEYNQKEQELMSSFDEELRKKGFSLGQIKVGEQIRPDIIPLIEGQPVPVFQLEELIKHQLHEYRVNP